VITGLVASALARDANAAALSEWLAREAPGSRGDELGQLAELLEHYLGALPGALDALTAMAKEPPHGRSVAFAAGQVLLYLVDEEDLFSEDELGALGLLDDAYLVHGCLAALGATFPGLEVPASYTPPGRAATAAVRALLPAGIPEALDRTCENLVRVAATLYAAGTPGPAAGDAPTWTLRVDEALATLRVPA
jgi:hypothetical protein